MGHSLSGKSLRIYNTDLLIKGWKIFRTGTAVSYTHLDVYKRQDMARPNPCIWTAKSYYKGTHTNDLDDIIIKKCFQLSPIKK